MNGTLISVWKYFGISYVLKFLWSKLTMTLYILEQCYFFLINVIVISVLLRLLTVLDWVCLYVEVGLYNILDFEHRLEVSIL